MRPLRILCFLQPGNVSRAFFLDLIQGLRAAGHTCLVTELAPVWRLCESRPNDRAALVRAATNQICGVITGQRVDLSISMWSNALSSLAHTSRDGKPLTCFEALDPPHPHVQYWLDAPHWAQGGSVRQFFPTGVFASPWLLNVINNEPLAEEMRRLLGFGHAFAMPYGVNPEVFRPSPSVPMAQREFDLAFALGPGDPAPTPTALAQLDRDDPDLDALRAESAASVAPRLDELAARAPASCRDQLLTLFQRLLALQLASRHTPMLERVDALRQSTSELRDAADTLLADRELYIDASATLRQVESFERIFTFAFLARRFRCLLFGQADAGAWGLHSTGFCAHEAQAAAYSRARLGLSVMRWQDEHGINLKPLEIGSSGAVPLVAQRVGLDRILEPGREAVVFSTPGQAARLAHELLGQPQRLDSMSMACRDRILKDHTWQVRSSTLLSHIGEQTARW